MAKKDNSPRLLLESATLTLGKISLNILHKDPELTIFTLPFDGGMLVKEQLDALMGKYTHNAWFETKKDGAVVPAWWWERVEGHGFEFAEAYSVASLVLELPGGKKLEFESIEAEGDADEIPAAKLTSIYLTPMPGGGTGLSFHLQVRPGLGNTNLALQKHQGRPIKITFGEMTLAQKKTAAKQQGLALEPPAGDAKPAEDSGEPASPCLGEGLAAARKLAASIEDDIAAGQAPAQLDTATQQSVEEFEASVTKELDQFRAKDGDVIDGRKH